MGEKSCLSAAPRWESSILSPNKKIHIEIDSNDILNEKPLFIRVSIVKRKPNNNNQQNNNGSNQQLSKNESNSNFKTVNNELESNSELIRKVDKTIDLLTSKSLADLALNKISTTNTQTSQMTNNYGHKRKTKPNNSEDVYKDEKFTAKFSNDNHTIKNSELKNNEGGIRSESNSSEYDSPHKETTTSDPNKPEFQTTSRTSLKLDHFRSGTSRLSLNNSSLGKKGVFPNVEPNIKTAHQQQRQKILRNKVFNLIESDDENDESLTQLANQNNLKLTYLKRYVANGQSSSKNNFTDAYWNRIPGSKLKTTITNPATTTTPTPTNNNKSNGQINYLNLNNSSLSLNNSLNLKQQQQQRGSSVAQSKKLTVNMISSTATTSTTNSITNFTNRELSIIDLQLPVLASTNANLSNSLPSQVNSTKRLIKSSHLNNFSNSELNVHQANNENLNDRKNLNLMNFQLASKLFKSSAQIRASNDSDLNEHNANLSENENQDNSATNDDSTNLITNRNNNFNKYIMEQQNKRQQQQQQFQTDRTVNNSNINRLSIKQELNNCASNVNGFTSNSLLIRRVKF